MPDKSKRGMWAAGADSDAESGEDEVEHFEAEPPKSPLEQMGEWLSRTWQEARTPSGTPRPKNAAAEMRTPSARIAARQEAASAREDETARAAAQSAKETDDAVAALNELAEGASKKARKKAAKRERERAELREHRQQTALRAESEQSEAERTLLEDEIAKLEMSLEVSGKAMPPEACTQILVRLGTMKERLAELDKVKEREESAMRAENKGTPKNPTKVDEESMPGPSGSEAETEVQKWLEAEKVANATGIAAACSELGVENLVNLVGYEYDEFIEDLKELVKVPKATAKKLGALLEAANERSGQPNGKGKGKAPVALPPKAKTAPAKPKPTASVSDLLMQEAGFIEIEPEDAEGEQQGPTEASSAMPDFCMHLELVARLIAQLPEAERKDKTSVVQLVGTALKIFGVESIDGDIELEAVQLEGLLEEAAKMGVPYQGPIGKVAKAKVLKQLIGAKKALDEKKSASSSPPPISGTTSVAMMAQVATAAAAGALAGSGDNSSSDNSVKDLASSRALERVYAVAKEKGAYKALMQLEALVNQSDGEDSLTQDMAQQFVDQWQEAERDHEALANLLHTTKIPTPTGLLAAPAPGLVGMAGDGIESAAAVARAARLVQELIPSAIAECMLSDSCDNGTKLAKSAFFGKIMGSGSSSSGGFKLEHLVDVSSRHLVQGKGAEETKALLDNAEKAITLALHEANPRDGSALKVMTEIYKAASGSDGKGSSHNTVYGLFFAAYAEAYERFQTRAGAMPKLKTVWKALQEKRSYKELVSADRARLSKLMERVTALEQRKTSERPERPKVKAEPKPTATTPNPSAGGARPPPTPPEEPKPNKIQGKARQELRDKMIAAREDYKGADTFAKAAEEAKVDNASLLRAEANEKKKVLDAFNAQLAEKQV